MIVESGNDQDAPVQLCLAPEDLLRTEDVFMTGSWNGGKVCLGPCCDEDYIGIQRLDIVGGSGLLQVRLDTGCLESPNLVVDELHHMMLCRLPGHEEQLTSQLAPCLQQGDV